MTNSRETDRRRAFKDRAQLDPTSANTLTDLRTLCIIRGCLHPRHGANMCRRCQNESDLKAETVR